MNINQNANDLIFIISLYLYRTFGIYLCDLLNWFIDPIEF